MSHLVHSPYLTVEGTCVNLNAITSDKILHITSDCQDTFKRDNDFEHSSDWYTENWAIDSDEEHYCKTG